MKSIYLRNFTATALLVLTCFILVAFSFVGIGRLYLIREYKSDMSRAPRRYRARRRRWVRTIL